MDQNSSAGRPVKAGSNAGFLRNIGSVNMVTSHSCSDETTIRHVHPLLCIDSSVYCLRCLGLRQTLLQTLSRLFCEFRRVRVHQTTSPKPDSCRGWFGLLRLLSILCHSWLLLPFG